MVFPNKGKCSYHSISGLRLTTSPMMVRAGGEIFSFDEVSTIVERVPFQVFWRAVVPHWITAIGVSGLLPNFISFFAINGSLRAPIRKTRVPVLEAILSQSIWMSPCFFSLLPVIMDSVEERSRCVRGIPA